jgi:hypothetical protein
MGLVSSFGFRPALFPFMKASRRAAERKCARRDPGPAAMSIRYWRQSGGHLRVLQPTPHSPLRAKTHNPSRCRHSGCGDWSGGRSIVHSLLSQKAASRCASGSAWSPGGSLANTRPTEARTSRISLRRLMLTRILLAYWMSLARSCTWLRFRGSSPAALNTSTSIRSAVVNGFLSHTCVRGELDTMPPSQCCSPSILTGGKPGGKAPLARTWSGSIRVW